MIRCELYDYIEIACLDSYQVKLRLADGSEITGQAETTGIDPMTGEYLQLVDANGQRLQAPLDSLCCLTVLSRPCRFEQVTFQSCQLS